MAAEAEPSPNPVFPTGLHAVVKFVMLYMVKCLFFKCKFIHKKEKMIGVHHVLDVLYVYYHSIIIIVIIL